MTDFGVDTLWAARFPGRSLAELAERQEGVLARGQLGLFGVSRHLIRSQLRARRWRLVARSVVIMGHGPVGELRRRWVAVLAAGPRAALGGLTAARTASGWRGALLISVWRSGQRPSQVAQPPAPNAERAAVERSRNACPRILPAWPLPPPP